MIEKNVFDTIRDEILETAKRSRLEPPGERAKTLEACARALVYLATASGGSGDQTVTIAMGDVS